MDFYKDDLADNHKGFSSFKFWLRKIIALDKKLMTHFSNTTSFTRLYPKVPFRRSKRIKTCPGNTTAEVFRLYFDQIQILTTFLVFRKNQTDWPNAVRPISFNISMDSEDISDGLSIKTNAECTLYCVKSKREYEFTIIKHSLNHYRQE